MKLSWEVDGVSVLVEKLEDGIEEGMERAVENILEILENDAKNTIRVNNRVFTGQVLNSFDDQTGNADIKSGLNSRFLNTAKHAGAVEHGVHASKYTGGGPPIAALMPWVLANLQDWQLEGGDSDSSSGDNLLKQELHEEVTQEVDTQINWSNISNYKYVSLDREEKNNLESSLKSSDLDDLSVDEMYNQVKSWKMNSNPYDDSSDTARIVQYTSDTKETFGLSGTPRGTDIYEPEPTYEETKQVLRTYHETSKIFSYNHLNSGDGTFTAHRYNGRTETANLGKNFWEDPLNDNWEIDSNVVQNYSTNLEGIDLFDKGLLHKRDVDIDEDLLYVVDHQMNTPNSQEAEVHVRGGETYTYDRDVLELTHGGINNLNVDDVLDEDFANANLNKLHDDELIALSSIVRNMDSRDVKVETDAARTRLNAWLDEFLARDLWEETNIQDYEWEQYVDYITS